MKVRVNLVKFIACFAVIGLSVWMTSISSYAAPEKIGTSDTYWEVTDNGKTLTITGTGAMPNFSVGDTPWITAGYRDFDKVVIGSGITVIGDSAFDAIVFKEVVWPTPNTVEVIRTNSFKGYQSDELIIPEGVTTIGVGAFYGNGAGYTDVDPRITCRFKKVVFPSTLNDIWYWVFSKSIEDGCDFYFLGDTPPKFEKNNVCFIDDHYGPDDGVTVNPKIHIYVPDGCVDAYVSALTDKYGNSGSIKEVPKTPTAAPVKGECNHDYEWVTVEEPTKETDGLEAEVCKYCGAIRETYIISAFGYALYDYASPMIDVSQNGQTVDFELGEWNSFPRWFMQKIAAKSAAGVTFEFHYNWNHESQTIIIPAGVPIDLNEEWYGPAKMRELYLQYSLVQ